VISIKKAGGKITGLTIWGLADDVTWIKGQKPLLFSTIGNPKTAYWSVLQAYKDSGVTQATVTPSSSSSTISNGWYYIKNVNAQNIFRLRIIREETALTLKLELEQVFGDRNGM